MYSRFGSLRFGHLLAALLLAPALLLSACTDGTTPSSLNAPTVSAPRAPTAQESAEIKAAVATFTDALRTGKHAAVIDNSLPPKVLAGAAAKEGVSPAEFREELIELTSFVMELVDEMEFTIDTDNLQVGESAPYKYAIMPSRTRVEITGLTNKTETGNVLALYDTGRWYLVRISDRKDVARLREYYPFVVALEL